MVDVVGGVVRSVQDRHSKEWVAPATVVGSWSCKEALHVLESISLFSRESTTKATTTTIGGSVPETPRVHVQRDGFFRTLACSTIYLLRLPSFPWHLRSQTQDMVAAWTP